MGCGEYYQQIQYQQENLLISMMVALEKKRDGISLIPNVTAENLDLESLTQIFRPKSFLYPQIRSESVYRTNLIVTRA